MEHRVNFNVPILNSVREEDGTFLIKGAAINEGTTRNDVLYSGNELRKGTPTLKDVPLLKDHNNSVDSIVGRTTNNIHYSNVDSRVNFEAKVQCEVMQGMIEDGRIKSVSVGCLVKSITPVLDKKEEPTGVIEAKGIEFLELSLVAVPADPGAGFAKALFESYQKSLKNPEGLSKEGVIPSGIKKVEEERFQEELNKTKKPKKKEKPKDDEEEDEKCGPRKKHSYLIKVPLGEKVAITLPN